MVGELDFRAAVERVLRGKRQPLGVRHGIVQRGLRELKNRRNEIAADVYARLADVLLKLIERRNLFASRKVGGLHAALVGRRNVRHLHDHIGRGLARAAQAPTGRVVLLGNMVRRRRVDRTL